MNAQRPIAIAACLAAVVTIIAARAAPGDLDPAFNPGVNDTVWCMAAQADGKVIIGGWFSTVGGTTRNNFARLNEDGTVDTAFNPGVSSDVYCTAVQADAKIVIGGWFSTVSGTARKCFARLNADGTPDAAFINPNVSAAVWSTAVQADGKIVIGGQFASVSGTGRNCIARLNADGALDAAFNPGADNVVQAIAMQADRKILIGGKFTQVSGTARNHIARLNADGTLDATFNPDASNAVQGIEVQPDGKIVIVGGFITVSGTERRYIARLNADGTLDAAFDLGSSRSAASAMAQPNGRLIIGANYMDVGWCGVMRLNADGMPDPAFNPPDTGGNSVLSMVLQPDGKIVIGGEFYTVSGTARVHIARLEGDGTLAVAQKGDMAEGVTTGAKFATLGNPIVNDAGQTAFLATLTGTDKAGTSALGKGKTGIWADDFALKRRLVARVSGTAPGTGGGVFTALTDPVMDNNGRVAFVGKASGGSKGAKNTPCVWSGTAGCPLSLAAYKDEAAPGGGVLSDFPAIALPDQGGAVMLVKISGVAGAKQGIYAVDTGGTLQLVVREGAVHPSNGKTIKTLAFLNGKKPALGQTRHFSQTTGDVLYTATFTDGTSGIYRVVLP
jgi:uncharacterized delta-60 repeat protein